MVTYIIMIVIHFKLIFNYYILKNFGKNKHLKNFRKKIFFYESHKIL